MRVASPQGENEHKHVLPCTNSWSTVLIFTVHSWHLTIVILHIILLLWRWNKINCFATLLWLTDVSTFHYFTFDCFACVSLSVVSAIVVRIFRRSVVSSCLWLYPMPFFIWCSGLGVWEARLVKKKKLTIVKLICL